MRGVFRSVRINLRIPANPMTWVKTVMHVCILNDCDIVILEMTYGADLDQLTIFDTYSLHQGLPYGSNFKTHFLDLSKTK